MVSLKMKSSLACLLAVVSLISGQQQGEQELDVRQCQEEHSWDNLNHFTEMGLIPSVLPCQPRHTATLWYDTDSYVLVGNYLTREMTKNEPTINLPSFIRGTNYTAIMIDIDAPSSEDPAVSPFLHFLAVNSFEVIIKASDKVASYVGPAPPPGSGDHRYIWLLYRQTRYIAPNTVLQYENDRENFDLEQFANDNGLSELASGNLFRVRS